MTIKIYDQIVLKDIDEVKPYWRNPRINDKTVDALVKIIPEVGFNVPIYIDNENVIIKGHARYRSAVKLGMKQIPCIISENTEEQNRLDRVADNKVSELAEWDIPELRYELEQIDFNLEDIGFDVPKSDFMDTIYKQEEYKEVSDEDFEKVKKEIYQKAVQNEKDLDIEAMPEGLGTTVEAKPRQFVKAKCPKCGEEVVIFL